MKERAHILEEYFCSKSYKETTSAFGTKYPHCSRPNKTIMRMVNSFRKGIFENKIHNRPRGVLTAEKVREIKSKFETNDQTSLRKMSAQVGVTRISLKCATEMLNLKPYKVNVIQELLPADCPQHVAFC